MESEIESLNKHRAEKAGDCRLWNPLECLEDIVKQIKAGKVKPSQLVVHLFEEKDDGGKTHHYAAAGVTYPHHIALLNIGLKRIIEEWME